MAELTFDSKLHRYFLDGREIPSVSEIMKPLTEMYYQKIPEKIIEKARIRGSAIHESIENYILFNSINEEYRQYVEMFIQFMNEEQLQVVRNEFMLTDGNYAGTIDLLLKTKYGDLILVDMKATSKINTELLELQLAGYDDLLKHNGYNTIGSYVLHFKKDGYVFKMIELNKEIWKELLDERTNKAHKD